MIGVDGEGKDDDDDDDKETRVEDDEYTTTTITLPEPSLGFLSEPSLERDDCEAAERR